MKTIFHNLKHFSITFSILLMMLVLFGIYIGADAHLYEDPLAYRLDGEVHAFYQEEMLSIQTLRGSSDQGFSVDEQIITRGKSTQVQAYYPMDDSSFAVPIKSSHQPPADTYNDGRPVLAISDIEGGFHALRKFLINHQVIDQQLNWTFGDGHLVLVGDFVDRGASVTPVLWLIYRLEQLARIQGGNVHYIIGNHEIKNLQGNFQAAHEKYFYIAGMLGRQQDELLGPNSVLGDWLASKNAVEVINGIAFVHGGLHPDLAEMSLTLAEMNQTIRAGYRQLAFSKQTPTESDFLQSSTTGPAWYRGYFKEDLTPDQIQGALNMVGAKHVVVGHTLQGNVTKLHDGLVYAIDVKHPQDYLVSFPPRSSEGLLVKNGQFYRLLEDGEQELL